MIRRRALEAIPSGSAEIRLWPSNPGPAPCAAPQEGPRSCRSRAASTNSDPTLRLAWRVVRRPTPLALPKRTTLPWPISLPGLCIRH